MVRILGVDPGSRKVGYGILECHARQINYVSSGVIRVKPVAHAQRLLQIYQCIQSLIMQYQPHEAAIEQVFVCKNVSSALKLGQARGAILVACAGLAVFEYAPRAIKKALVGYGQADKLQMQAMIKQVLNLSAHPQEDAADGLAVAWCQAQHRVFAQQLARENSE